MAKQYRVGTGKVILVIVLVSLFSATILVVFHTNLLGNGAAKRALIADGLWSDYPNRELIDSVKALLEMRGYQVDVYLGGNVTLDLYSRLTDYDIVILRVHGGKAEITTPRGRVALSGLFTGQKWSSEYEWMKREWLATRAKPYNSNEYYVAALPRFFEEKLQGRFREGSVVIASSCYSLYTYGIPDALAKKGLHYYIGWRGPVTLSHMDEALLLLIEKAVGEGKDWREAVIEVNNELGADPLTQQKLSMIVYKSP